MPDKQLLKKGFALFNEGGYSNYAYIIDSGSIEVSITDEQGEKRILGILKKNDMVGEMGLIDGSPRSATATAIEDCYVTAVSRGQFMTLARNSPNALIPILKVLATRLRATMALLKKCPVKMLRRHALLQ